MVAFCKNDPEKFHFISIFSVHFCTGRELGERLTSSRGGAHHGQKGKNEKGQEG